MNATTGYSPFIQGTSTGDATTRGRLQVFTTDVANQPSGTRFFADAWYVTQDDCQFVRPGQTVATNGLNSASWVEINASTINATPAIGTTNRHNPGIYAWLSADPAVTLVSIDDDTMVNPGTAYENNNGVPITGKFIRARFWVGAKVVSIGGGLYRYEYAVYNHNHDRSGQSFTVPLPGAASISDVSFHAPQWHSGEPYSNTPWTSARNGDTLIFSTQTYAQNQNANALRWGELFNFGFTTNAAPTSGSSTIALFKPAAAGQPAALTVPGIPIPLVCGSADFNHDGDVGTDADVEAFFACLGGNCCPTCGSADFNNDGDVGTDADIESFFRVLAGGAC